LRVERLEQEIAEALISWRDRLRAALRARFDEARARALERRYASAFPASYRQDVEAAQAVEDISISKSIDSRPGDDAAAALPAAAAAARIGVHLAIIRRGEALSVSEVLAHLRAFRPARDRRAPVSAELQRLARRSGSRTSNSSTMRSALCGPGSRAG
jgi:glutamate dehydrogenase